MAAFVPARVRRGAVEHAVADEERHAPTRCPRAAAAPAPKTHEAAEPDRGVADRRAGLRAASAPSSACAGCRCGTTRRRRGRISTARCAVPADQAVVAFGGCDGHRRFSAVGWPVPADRSCLKDTRGSKILKNWKIESIICYHVRYHQRSASDDRINYHISRRPMSKRPTISDLAEAAGVSVATVDRVLNGRLPVREATARRVYEAATATGYHAAGLIRQRMRQDLPEYRLGFLLLTRETVFLQHIRQGDCPGDRAFAAHARQGDHRVRIVACADRDRLAPAEAWRGVAGGGACRRPTIRR